METWNIGPQKIDMALYFELEQRKVLVYIEQQMFYTVKLFMLSPIHSWSIKLNDRVPSKNQIIGACLKLKTEIQVVIYQKNKFVRYFILVPDNFLFFSSNLYVPDICIRSSQPFH
jgi:hypothetical protein